MEKSSRAMNASTSSPSSPVMTRRASYRALGSRSPRPGVATLSCEPPCGGEPRHFLDACHLCRRQLGRARDIFMYRGDMPFCSEECRQEQIELDEAREEEEAGYWRSRRSHLHRSGHRVTDPAAEAAELQSIQTRAAETTVAS